MPSNDLYERVTAAVIKDLENNCPTWVKPWKDQKCGGIMPQNAATGRPYSGINIPILWGVASALGYEKHLWLTFKQAIDQKARVRKGEKGTQVVFTKRMRRDEDDDRKTFSMLKTFYVFNISQIEGLPDETAPLSEPIVGYEPAERFIEATKADIRYGGSKACFVPSVDFIAMPPVEAFDDVGSFYCTVLHELGHWSGHKPRLDRDLANRFGTKAYAAEELIAELTAAFLCAHLEIKGELRHASYIQSWIELLRGDKRAIFTAASQASKAADYLRSFSESGGDDDAIQPDSGTA